jgi:L-iditol 2-dehydrogenase
MLAAVLAGPNDLRLEQLEVKDPGPGELLVKVGADTICGTDLRILRGEKTSGVRAGAVLGHEIAGHVEAAGAGLEGWDPGQPVAIAPVVPCGNCWECKHGMENMCSGNRIIGYEINGGMAERMLIPADAVARGNVFKAAVDLPSEQLALAEPLSCVVNGQRRSDVRAGSNVLIMGAGPIGLFHLQLARLSGADAVIVSEPADIRRAHAERFGATATVDPTSGDLDAAVLDATGGIGVDAAIVCIGIPPLINQAINLTRPGGTINIFAGLKDKGWAEVEGNRIHYKELVVTGTSNSRRADYAIALRMIEAGRIDTAAMVTHRFPLESVVEAIETVTSREAIKVAVLPGAPAA